MPIFLQILTQFHYTDSKIKTFIPYRIIFFIHILPSIPNS